MKKFILDTNVLLHDPNCLTKFEDNEVIIAAEVLDELDHLKVESSERGVSARKVQANMKELFNGHDPFVGAPLAGGGKLYLVTNNEDSIVYQTYPKWKVKDLLINTDHALLNLAWILGAKNKDAKTKVIIVSKDTNLFLKSKSLHLEVEDYKNERAKPESLSLREANVVELKEHDVEMLERNKSYPITFPGVDNLEINQWIILTVDGREVGIARHLGEGRFQQCRIPERLVMPKGYTLEPRNVEQRMFLDALLDPKISLVTCESKAGTGKTLLTIAAALYQTLGNRDFDSIYNKLVISRPIVGVGRDLGALPGGIEEKMSPWLAGYNDNLDLLMRAQRPEERTRKDRKHERKHRAPAQPQPAYGQNGGFAPRKPGELLIQSGIVEIQALMHVRGRSLHNTFLMVDEAQNTTPHEIKTLVTRVGQGSKIVIIGDTDQIDTPYMDKRSNGLAVLREKFRNKALCAHINLKRGQRSALAEMAADIL